jgi:hypothetical protein
MRAPWRRDSLGVGFDLLNYWLWLWTQSVDATHAWNRSALSPKADMDLRAKANLILFFGRPLTGASLGRR